MEERHRKGETGKNGYTFWDINECVYIYHTSRHRIVFQYILKRYHRVLFNAVNLWSLYLPPLHHILLFDCDSIIDAIVCSVFCFISHGLSIIPLCMCCFDAIYLYTRRWLLTVPRLDRHRLRKHTKQEHIGCETIDEYIHRIEWDTFFSC